MRRFVILILIIISYNIFSEVNDFYNPSDSGDMKWLNYEITKFNAGRGDVISKIHLLKYYIYNDELNDLSRGGKIKEFIMEIIQQGFGGVKKGGDGVVIDLINECERKRLVMPLDVVRAFEVIKTTGGGLTPLGRDIEMRWRKGDFVSCPFTDISN